MQTKLNLFGSPVLLKPFQPAFSLIVAIFSLQTQLSTLVIHILHSNLDMHDEDIVCMRKDLTRKAYCMLATFILLL